MRHVSKRVSRAQKHVVALCCFTAMTLTFVIAIGSPTIPLEFELRIVEADSLVVVKGLRELRVYVDGQVERVYCIGLGVNADGPKRYRGDRRTPEGLYTIDWRNPESSYYKALHISYPNAVDKVRARKRGRHPGGNILIHGRPNEAAHLPEFDWATNWTDGCIAVDNSHMDELWSIVPDGCPIRILP
jgi:murein L,D-transpeptidase YafK